MALVPRWPSHVPGLATRLILPTAAEPTAIFTVRGRRVAGTRAARVVLLPAPPDDATIVAVPDVAARNLTIARPLTSVSASPAEPSPASS
jgi:hypothetical protein